MAKKSSKTKKNVRMIACEHLVTLNEISNNGEPLCNCEERKFNLSPFNIVCQICELYRERKDEKTHEEMYVAADAADFNYDLDDIDINDDDFEDEVLEYDDDDDDEDLDEDEDEDEVEVRPKKKARVSRKAAKVDEDDDEEEEELEEEEEFEDDEEVALVIGVTKEKDEDDELDYVDEREEGLGKKHGKIFEEDELEAEDEELEDELEELEDDIIGIDDSDDETEEDEDFDDEEEDEGSTTGAAVDFEKDVIAKIKTVGSGDNQKQICPFCQKSKVSVLRHLPKCKRTPENVKAAYQEYKKKK